MCSFLTSDQQIANQWCYSDQNKKKKFMEFSDCLKNSDRKYKESIDWKFLGKMMEDI